MFRKIKSLAADAKLLLRSVPSIVVVLFTISVIVMNILANKTIYRSGWLAVDGGIILSWLSFLCMDVVTKAFGPKAATKLSIFALFINLFVCVTFFLVSIIPSREDFSAFNTVIGGTWFILLSSSVAFISSAIINNFLNWGIGRLFRRHPDGKAAYIARCYVSTFVAQFFDNFIFAGLAFMVFAPVYWSGFRWTFIQCVACSLLGAFLELVMEVVFSPIGYVVLKKWKAEGVGEEYRRRHPA